MPKRVVDGEGIWRSNKLALLPPEMKAELANLIPLALANGSFECTPEEVWSRVYAKNRREVPLDWVVRLLDELERAKILFRWNAEGRTWGYWTAIDKPGRLPPPSRRGDTAGRHEALGAEPPRADLDALLGHVANGQPMANRSVTCGQPLVTERLVSGCLGFGLGSGTGSGTPTEGLKPSTPDFPNSAPPEEPAYDPAFDDEQAFTSTVDLFPETDGGRLLRDYSHRSQVRHQEAIAEIQQALSCSAPEAAEWLKAKIREYLAGAKPDYHKSFLGFLDSKPWRNTPAETNGVAPPGFAWFRDGDERVLLPA